MDDCYMTSRPSVHHQSFMSHEIDGVRKEEDKLTASLTCGYELVLLFLTATDSQAVR